MSPDHGAPGRSRRLHPEAIADYVIVRPLDAGGMGVIFEARHRHTGAPAAIKTVQPGVAGAESAIRREIGALRGIDHPGVIKVLDEGAWEGMPWYAMELIEGPSLVDALATRATGPALATRPGPSTTGTRPAISR